MNIQLIPTAFDDVFIILPKRFVDSRGYFSESFNPYQLSELLPSLPSFTQDNESCSKRGVFRGLHLQESPHGQTKLVRVSQGVIIDFVVGVQPDKPHYGKYLAVELSAQNGQQLLIPPYYAHGFLALAEQNVVHYKVDAPYQPEAERSFLYSSPLLQLPLQQYIDTDQPIISSKDLRGTVLS